MILYHSSNIEVSVPDVLHSREGLDFGRGFYLTSLRQQAIDYARRFSRRGQDAWLNSFEFSVPSNDWNIREFLSYDVEWLDFISKCRSGNDDSNYDLVIGGIANDKVIRTLDRYFAGELTVEQTLGLLKFERPNIQYCIRNQAMLDRCLHFIESKKL